MKPRRWLFIALGITTGLIGSLVLTRVSPVSPEDGWIPDSPFLPDPLPPPTLLLTDHEGRPFDLRELRGRPVAVFFGYTFCPDVCPVTMANLTRAAADLGTEGVRLAIVFVSVDPARDTPEVLTRFRSAFGTPIITVTGSEEHLREQAAGFGVTFRIGAGETEYTVDHSARTYLLDGEGRIIGTLPPLPSPTQAAVSLRAFLERVR